MRNEKGKTEWKEKSGKRRGVLCVSHCIHSLGETRGNNNTVYSCKELLGANYDFGSLCPVIL